MALGTYSRGTRPLQYGTLFLLITLFVFTPLRSYACMESSSGLTDLTGVNVAIYNGTGVTSSSVTALTNMFEWMNASVASVKVNQILDDFLDDYDIVVFPGGSETSYSSFLDTEGRQKIKDFVAGGGSYFGICGGSTFGAHYLRFFRGSTYPVSEPGLTQHLTTMHINQTSTGPNLSDCPENVSTMYYASQCFVPSTGFSVIPIATYDYNDEPGMIAFEHQNGTVFLSSPHPEYEEGSDRDGTDYHDELDDPESEWDLLLRVSTWLIEISIVEEPDPEPTSTSNPTEGTTSSNATSSNSIPSSDVTIVGIASIGIIAVVFVVAIFYKRKIG